MSRNCCIFAPKLPCRALVSFTAFRVVDSAFHFSLIGLFGLAHHKSARSARCYYMDRAWHISSAIWFMATHSGRVTWRLEGSYSHGLRMRTRPAATLSNKPSPGL